MLPSENLPLSLITNHFTPVFIEENEENEPIPSNSALSYQNTCLLKLFKDEPEINYAISALRNDRLLNSDELNKLLRKTIPEFSTPNEDLIQKDPLLSLFILMLNDIPADVHLRDLAAEAYIKKFPDDTRFEKAYVYLKTPHILLTHLLINTGKWKCCNPANEEFYDEQMAGLFHGTIAFDKGDRISQDELTRIQEKEGENPQFPIAVNLKEKDGYFEVIAWCSTPQMCPSETRLDDLFITNRRKKQDEILNGYIKNLQETSSIVQETYNLSPNESAVVAIIGPYGVGKTTFIQLKFSESKNLTTYSLDNLNTSLMEPNSRPQDHHFEAMMLTKKLLSRVLEIPALLTETAAIDSYRFFRMLKDFSSRDRIIIEEIAPEKPSDSVKRYIEREKIIDQSRIGAANTSANDALRYRHGRIEKIKENSKINYTLYCKPSENEKQLIEVAKVQNGEVLVTVGQEELYDKLIKNQYFCS